MRIALTLAMTLAVAPCVAAPAAAAQPTPPTVHQCETTHWEDGSTTVECQDGTHVGLAADGTARSYSQRTGSGGDLDSIATDATLPVVGGAVVGALTAAMVTGLARREGSE